ncbi:epidermal growth factor receptor substrate 15-like protein 1, partial [Tanacetum coccineum]
IWQHADQNRTGFLGRQEFFNALKLVTVAQSKRELTPDIVKAALYGPASSKIPAPQINLAALPPAQPNPLAPRPPKRQPGLWWSGRDWLGGKGVGATVPKPQEPILSSSFTDPRPSTTMFGGDLFSASQSISKASSSSMPTQTASIPPVSFAIVPVTSKPQIEAAYYNVLVNKQPVASPDYSGRSGSLTSDDRSNTFSIANCKMNYSRKRSPVQKGERETKMAMKSDLESHQPEQDDEDLLLAHYFVMAVEARLAGTGAEVYREASLKKISHAHILKANHSYLMALSLRPGGLPMHAPDYWYKPSTTGVPPSRVEETVNSVKRLRNILDEMVIESSPRDTVLQLIRQINPGMFVLGILNGAYNAPFLLNRLNTYAINSSLKL